MKTKVNIIGAGFSSLAAACYLSEKGYEVEVFEKNKSIGGRARQLDIQGCKFDMGPTWYWMPDVFEKFFSYFGKKPSDYYELERLNPAYEVFFGEGNKVKVPGSIDEIYKLFDKKEKDGAKKLKQFLDKAEDNYAIAIKDLVYKPGVSPMELVSLKTLTRVGRFFTNIRKEVRKLFDNEELIEILEFPVLFLGAKPQDTPSFYSFMNYADLVLGTWYPKGGMFSVVDGIYKLSQELGVKINTNSSVDSIVVRNDKAVGLMINGAERSCDVVLSGADYSHSETLFPEKYRQYSSSFWEKKTFAPSSLLFYIGLNKKLINVEHHCLFFDKDFDTHALEIYDNPKWPKEPLFYGSFPTISDTTITNNGIEMATFLVPLAPGLEDSPEQREAVFNNIITRFERLTNQKVQTNIEFMESYCVNDFIEDYNSYKGNAYGLANNLMQTAFLRPKLKSKKLKNMYFTGQLTVPGPGVPPALISGNLVADLINKDFKTYENNF